MVSNGCLVLRGWDCRGSNNKLGKLGCFLAILLIVKKVEKNTMSKLLQMVHVREYPQMASSFSYFQVDIFFLIH